MSQIDFSIIFPSRDHQDLLLNLLKSISQTTEHLDRIEVLIAIDSDDSFMNDFAGQYQFSFVKFFKVQRSLNFSKDYYNYLYRQSSGKWIIACNDDTEFLTHHWDTQAKNVLEHYIRTTNGKNIVYGWIEDMLGTHRLVQYGKYCCFPLIGREGADAMSCIFPPRIPTWGADLWAEKLYRNVGRIIQLPIVIKHVSVHNKLRPPDAIHHRIAQNQVPVDMNPEPQEINALITALKSPRQEPPTPEQWEAYIARQRG